MPSACSVKSPLSTWLKNISPTRFPLSTISENTSFSSNSALPLLRSPFLRSFFCKTDLQSTSLFRRRILLPKRKISTEMFSLSNKIFFCDHVTKINSCCYNTRLFHLPYCAMEALTLKHFSRSCSRSQRKASAMTRHFHDSIFPRYDRMQTSLLRCNK